MNENWIWLFSSNIRALYAQDISNVIGLPIGARYQFRYNEKWASVEANDAWLDPLHPLVGLNGLVVFSYQHQKKLHPPAFLPCRRVKILNAERQGSFLITEFEIGENCSLDSTVGDAGKVSSSIGIQMQTFSRQVEHTLTQGCPGNEIDKSVVPGPAPGKLINVDLSYGNAWEWTVQCLAESGAFPNHLFFRIVGLSEVGSTVNLALTEGRWEICAGKSYVFELFHYQPDPPSERKSLDVLADGDAVTVQGTNQVVVSSGYDRIRVVFHANYRDEPKDTIITIQPSANGSGTSVQLALHIVPPKAEKAIRGVLATGAVFCAAVPGMFKDYRGNSLLGMITVVLIGAGMAAWLSVRSRIRPR